MAPLSLSNNAGSTALQPPRSSIVHSFCGVGKSLANSAATDGIDRPETGLRPDLLPLRGVQEVLQRGGLVQVARWGDDGDRVLDLERLRRVDVLDRLALPLDVDRLVLVAEQHVAGALQEHVGGLAARPGPGLDVLGDQLVDEVQAGLRVLTAVALGGVRRQQVPLGRARAQRARA